MKIDLTRVRKERGNWTEGGVLPHLLHPLLQIAVGPAIVSDASAEF